MKSIYICFFGFVFFTCLLFGEEQNTSELENVAYLTSGSELVMAYDLKTSKALWSTTVKGCEFTERDASPVVINDLVIVASRRAAKKVTKRGQACEIRNRSAAAVIAFNKSTGEIKWRYDIDKKPTHGEVIVSQPLYLDGNVYVEAGYYDEDRRKDAQFGKEKLHAISIEKGKKQWVVDIEVFCSRTMAVEGKIIVSLPNAGMSAIDPQTGKILWKSDFYLGWNPAYREGLLFLSEADKKIKAVDVETGKKKWDMEIPEYSEVSFFMGGDFLFLVTKSGVLYGIDLNTRKVAGKLKVCDRVVDNNWFPFCANGKIYIPGVKDNKYGVFCVE